LVGALVAVSRRACGGLAGGGLRACGPQGLPNAKKALGPETAISAQTAIFKA